MTAPTIIPTSPSELEAMLDDSATMQALFKEGKFGEFTKNYMSAFQAKNADFAQQVRQEVQKVTADLLREHGNTGDVSRPDLTPATRTSSRATLYGKNAPGTKVDQLFKNQDHTDFLRAIWYRNNEPKAIEAQNKLREIRASFGSTIPSDGGFLIPETLRSNLLQVALETAIVRPRATVIPMDSLRVPFPTIDDTSHASSVYGGMIGFWTEEAGALSESEAKFGRVVLEAKKLTGYSEVPNELFTDSIVSFQAFLDNVWPQAIAFFEDDAFINGSGVGEPLGFLNGSAAISVTRGTASKVKFADIIAMYTRMLPASLNSAVWICSPAVIAELLQLVLATGGTGNETVAPPLWLTGGGAQQGPTMMLLGRPLLVSEKVPNLGVAGDLTFVDLSYYLVGDRQSMSMETSSHFKFKNDETAVRIIERVDGRPWINSALTPANGGPTLSPIVKLGTI